MFLIPLFLTGALVKLGAAVGLYAIAFASAGVVTPGLQQWTLSLVDVGRRGRYLAQKDILAFSVNSVATLFLSRHLDEMIKLGNAQEGYETVGIVCLVLSVIDALLLMQVCERPAEQPVKMHLKDLLQPVRDTKYRPLLLYSTLAGLIGGISTPFLVVYQLRVLGLSHTFLASAGIAVAVSSMAGSYLWGRYSDLNTWNRTILRAAFAVFICTLSWAFVTPKSAPYIAPVLMALTSANSAGAFLQSQLEPAMGYRSIAVLFLISGVGGIINLFINGRKIPSVK